MMEPIQDELQPLLRQLVWDMVCHQSLEDPAEQIRYGLKPASPDVMEMEHAAADARIATVYPLYLQVSIMSKMAGLVAHEGILNSPDSDSLAAVDPDQLGVIIGISALAILMGLVDAGLLKTDYPEVHFHG